jgi:hypothetical protein
MTPERWRRIEELYHAVLAQDAAERAAFLAEACAGDEGLRQEVESLLANPASVEGFLDRPAMAVAAQMVSDVVASRLVLAAGDRLGPYEIVGALGAGGMDI